MFSVPLSGPSYEAVLRASEVSLMKLPSILPSHHRGTQRCLQNHSGLNHVKIEHLANPVKFLPDRGCDIKETHGEVKNNSIVPVGNTHWPHQTTQLHSVGSTGLPQSDKHLQLHSAGSNGKDSSFPRKSSRRLSVSTSLWTKL